MAAGIGNNTPYRPSMFIQCRLIRASDHAILMRDGVAYNRVAAPRGYISLAPDPGYAFATFDGLSSDPDRAVAAIDGALQESARTIGKLLK